MRRAGTWSKRAGNHFPPPPFRLHLTADISTPARHLPSYLKFVCFRCVILYEHCWVGSSSILFFRAFLFPVVFSSTCSVANRNDRPGRQKAALASTPYRYLQPLILSVLNSLRTFVFFFCMKNVYLTLFVFLFANPCCCYINLRSLDRYGLEVRLQKLRTLLIQMGRASTWRGPLCSYRLPWTWDHSIVRSEIVRSEIWKPRMVLPYEVVHWLQSYASLFDACFEIS